MSEIRHDDARAMAQQKMREAREWWGVWELEIHRYRYWRLIYAVHTHALTQYWQSNHLSFHHAALIRGRDEAHDRMLCVDSNIVTAAASATSLEMASKIYYEEYEERAMSNAYDDYRSEAGRG